MRACAMLEPQMGMTYDRIVEVAKLATSIGLEGTFRSDHYTRARNDDPVTDAWATIAGLVRDLDSGVVGTLVSPVRFRHPGNLAKVVATVAHMSRGATVELGLGAGWQESEHRAFGFGFGTFTERFAILEEYLQVVHGILKGKEFSHRGAHFTLEECQSAPAAPDVRIIVGGTGPRRTPRLAARFADEMNMAMLPPQVVAERVRACRESADRIGREASEITFSWMGQFLVGRTEAELKQRAGRLGQAFGADAEAVLGRLRGRAIVGVVDEATEALGRLREAGIERVMLQHMTDDDDHLAVAARAAAAA